MYDPKSFSIIYLSNDPEGENMSSHAAKSLSNFAINSFAESGKTTTPDDEI